MAISGARGCMLRHAIHAVGRAARTRIADWHHTGRAHARVVRFTPLGLKIGKSTPRDAGGGGTGRVGARLGQPLGAICEWRDPYDRAVPFARILPKLREECPTSSSICARNNQRRLRLAPSRACRLRAPALPYHCGDVESVALFEDRLFVAFRKPRCHTRRAHPTDAIDETRLLLLGDGHCLKDHALAACNRPELRAEAAMLDFTAHTDPDGRQ